MNDEERRDLAAYRAVQRQYKRAERMHRNAGNELMVGGWFGLAGDELMVGGWFGLAGDEFNVADTLEAAAVAERTCAPLHGTRYITLEPPK